MTTNTNTRTDSAAQPSPAIEFALKYPFINAAGMRVERLALRRAKRADFRAAAQYSKDDFDQETFLFARLAGLTLEDLDNLDMEDNNQLVQRFRELLGKPAAQP